MRGRIEKQNILKQFYITLKKNEVTNNCLYIL